MHEPRIEKEVEICATNLANKTKFMSTNSEKWKKFVKTEDSNTKKKYYAKYQQPQKHQTNLQIISEHIPHYIHYSYKVHCLSFLI
jgi:hypothetical protein